MSRPIVQHAVAISSPSLWIASDRPINSSSPARFWRKFSCSRLALPSESEVMRSISPLVSSKDSGAPHEPHDDLPCYWSSGCNGLNFSPRFVHLPPTSPASWTRISNIVSASRPAISALTEIGFYASWSILTFPVRSALLNSQCAKTGSLM